VKDLGYENFGFGREFLMNVFDFYVDSFEPQIMLSLISLDLVAYRE
jgi:hypothetical protein